jgi:lipoprotein-releasing system permease protein
MFKPYLVFIALRYVRARKSSQILSFISWFCLLGMTLGVTALVLVLSVMNGFEDELKNRLLHVLPHGYVKQDLSQEQWPLLSQSILGIDGMVGVAPFIEGEAMVSVSGVVRAVRVTGVDVDAERAVSLIDDFLVAGQFDDLSRERYGIVIGSILARQLGVWLGDKVTVILPSVTVTPAGVFPRLKRFTVTAVFEVGAQIDSTDALIALSDADKLYRRGGKIDGLRLQTDDIYSSQGVFREIKSVHPNLVISDWSQSQGSLFQAIKMEKLMVSLLLAIVVLVAAFNIVSLLSMMVTDKQTEISVLRTMGASSRDVMFVFLLQGLLVGGAGTIIGTLFGVVLALTIGDLVALGEAIVGIKIFDPSVYFISTLPSKLLLSDVLSIAIFSILLSFVATLYPAYQASKVPPANALRYG